MALRSSVPPARRATVLLLAGALASFGVAVALFTRFGINGELSRDEAIYVYGGQQLSHGVAPYASIFDPKTPLATMIAGLAAAAAHALGRDDVYAIRATFFVISCLTVVAVFVLATQLWRSVLAGVAAAVVFASFRGFAADALSGPDAKTPGILLAVVAMVLMVRRWWFWAALAGSCAALVWQPLVLYPAVAVLLAVAVAAPRRRLAALGRAVAGAVAPFVAVGAYFAAVGGLGRFVEAALVFPLVGVRRAHQTLLEGLVHIAGVVRDYYLFSGVLFWIGLGLLLVLVVAHVVRHRANLRAALLAPLPSVVALTGLGQVAYAASDFQGYPDLYPLLPYAALGLGGAVAAAGWLLHGGRVGRAATGRRVAGAAVLAALGVLTAWSWSSFTGDVMNDHGLIPQRSAACGVTRLLAGGGTLYALGDPVQLALTHRRNPDRFVYLQSGVDEWKIEHTPGGFAGWAAQVRAAHPSVVTVGGWHTKRRYAMGRWLRRSAGYRPAHVGKWFVLVTPQLRADAPGLRVDLTRGARPMATTPAGGRIPAFGCRRMRE